MSEVQHGTRAYYQRFQCDCLPCRSAEATYRARLRRLHARGKTPLGAHVDASEAWRLIRKLKIEHYHTRDMARAFGLKRPRLEWHTDVITFRNLLKVRRLYRSSLGGDSQHV